MEYLARVAFDSSGLLYPDSVVGTDSHTTMINGLGVVGWGVGGIEAEAVMLGQPISMVLPKVVGYRITGEPDTWVTSTDVVLTITKHLRQVGVVGKFVEFYGPGVEKLSIADRATIANMCPEYGATIGQFYNTFTNIDHEYNVRVLSCGPEVFGLPGADKQGKEECGVHHSLPESCRHVQRLQQREPGPGVL